MTLIELTCGPTRLVLAPEVGGGVAGLSWNGRDLFQPARMDLLAAGDPLGLSSFPLVPFAGRVDQGRFAFAGRDIQLPADLPPEPHAIHGQGWRGPWRVAERSADRAVLTFDHQAGAWPWAYQALQTFQVTPRGLVHGLSVTNLGDEPMPAGLGLHPYFPRDADTRFEASIGGYIPNDDQMRPLPEALPPAACDWRTNPPIPGFVDNQFTGWDGQARLCWAGLTLAITVEPAVAFLVVYAPTGEDFLCVEPVSHGLGGLNQGDGGVEAGMVLLKPGQSLSLTARFEVE